MPTVITFDGEDLADANIVTRYAKHESPAERSVSRVPISREDGSIFVTSRYGEKTIEFQGQLVGSSQADLEQRIDDLKELLSREQRELEIDWDASTRVYIATVSNLEFDRDHYNVTHVPFSGEFLVVSGFGQDSTPTAALTNEALTTTTPVSDTFDLLGTKPGRPIMNIQGNNWPTGVLGLSVENTDTGEKVDITSTFAWSTATEIEIDFMVKKVEHIISSVRNSLDFYGTLPKWQIGTNNFKLTVGKLPNIRTSEASVAAVFDGSPMDGDLRYAQSFQVPYTNATFQMIRIPLKSFGTPLGNAVIEIRKDSGGNPTGSVIATFTMASGFTTSSYAYYEMDAGAPFTLNANQTYWMVIYGTSWTGSNGMWWGAVPTVNGIPGSIMRSSSNDGATWGVPIAREGSFVLYYGGLEGASAVLMDVNYLKEWL